MQRQSVSSSNIASIGYDEATQTLEIEFHGGGIYQYHGVPINIYQGLMSASSHGHFFHEFIKDRFSFTKIA